MSSMNQDDQDRHDAAGDRSCSTWSTLFQMKQAWAMIRSVCMPAESWPSSAPRAARSRVGDRHGVGARLLDDLEGDRLAAGPYQGAPLGKAVLDAADVAQAHRRPVGRAGDDDVANGLDAASSPTVRTRSRAPP
jgi:hypothetical protein